VPLKTWLGFTRQDSPTATFKMTPHLDHAKEQAVLAELAEFQESDGGS
jgi:hypothetical protein